MVTRDEITAPGSDLHDLPPVLFAQGDRSLLSLTASAVLNSRKSRQVTPYDYWIGVTKERVRFAMEAGNAIVSSYGNLSYSLVTFLAKDFPLILACDDVLPFMDSERKAVQFRSAYGDLFNPELTMLISSFPPGRSPSRPNRLAERDQVVAALSSVLMIGEVRPEGNMAQILEIASRRQVQVIGDRPGEMCDRAAKELNNNVRVKSAGQSPPRQSGPGGAGSNEVRWPDFGEFSGESSYLIHYTRSCPGPWPGQTMAQYCRSLIDGSEVSAHKAFDTLQRILDEKLIRGSNRLTRGTASAVSLTECLPNELSTIVTWRPGLIRWNFEPYGLAVQKNALMRLGARPVVYGTEETLRELPEDEKYLFQIKKTDEKDWTAEKEWRLAGDLLLAFIKPDDLVVIVPDPEEARIIENRFGYRVFFARSGKCRSDSASGGEDRSRACGFDHRTSHGA